MYSSNKKFDSKKNQMEFSGFKMRNYSSFQIKIVKPMLNILVTRKIRVRCGLQNSIVIDFNINTVFITDLSLFRTISNIYNWSFLLRIALYHVLLLLAVTESKKKQNQFSLGQNHLDKIKTKTLFRPFNLLLDTCVLPGNNETNN